MRYPILTFITLLFVGLSCQQLSPRFAVESPVEMECLDSLRPEISKLFFSNVCLETSNKLVARIDGCEPGSIKVGFPGSATIYLKDRKTRKLYDSLHVTVNMPDGISPVSKPLLEFGCSVEQVVEYETSLGFNPEVRHIENVELGIRQTSVKSSRLFYGNYARGVYYNFDAADSLRQIVIPFLFDMVEDNKERFAEYVLVQGLPAAVLGRFSISLLYSGEDEKEYLAAYETMKSGAVDNPALAGKIAVCNAFTEVVEPALIYFPVKDLYIFPQYSYDLW